MSCYVGMPGGLLQGVALFCPAVAFPCIFHDTPSSQLVNLNSGCSLALQARAKGGLQIHPIYTCKVIEPSPTLCLLPGAASSCCCVSLSADLGFFGRNLREELKPTRCLFLVGEGRERLVWAPHRLGWPRSGGSVSPYL